MAVTKKQKEQNNSKKIILGAAAVLFLIIIVLIVVKLARGEPQESPSTTSAPVSTTQPPVVNLNPLTGEAGYSSLGSRPVAVMINNSRPARPQWGLCSPDVVVEGVTEAGITRMMWLYADVDRLPDKLGSLRSARHDFVEIAQGLDALFVHWGGSTYAYDAIESRSIDHLDGRIYSGRYFFRDTQRTNVAIEHRGYTTRDAVKEGFATLGLRTDLNGAYASPLKFTSADSTRTPSGGACSGIDIVFSSYCNHTFSFDSADSLYYNNINGSPMNDADGRQMAVKNVIILYCGVSSMGDASGCVDMDLSGGDGLLLTNGAYENISWKKGGSDDMLKLYGSDGNELELNAGKSYIGLVPSSQRQATQISA